MRVLHLHRAWRTMASLLVAALVVTACGGADTAADAGGGDADAADAADAGGGEVEVDEAALELFEEMTPADDAEEVDTSVYVTDAEQLRIGYADFGPVNSWRVQALGSTEILAEELGVELLVTDAQGDANKQISDTEDLLAQGIDALLISPVAPEQVAPVIERAHDAGIPVIVWGSEADTDRYTAKVVDDARFFGYEGGRKLAEDMGGEGDVIMLRGIAGNSVEQERYDGAVDALSEYPDIQIVGEDYGDWAFDQGKAITENLLAAHPEVDGVWSSGAAMTRGAIEAFKEADRDLVPMSGENLNGFLKLWAELDLQSSAPQFPTWQGPEALKLAVRALRGLPIESSYLLRPPAITDAASTVVEDASDDYWVEDYLTREEIEQIFPS